MIHINTDVRLLMSMFDSSLGIVYLLLERHVVLSLGEFDLYCSSVSCVYCAFEVIQQL